MAHISASDARKRLPDLLDSAHSEGRRTIIERHGKAWAAIVPIEDLEQLQAMEDEADARIARARLKEGKFVDWSDVKKALGL